MQIKNQIEEVLHRIRVKLYPNYFQHVNGAYIARTDSERTLDVRDVCSAAISRGGVEGDLDDFMEFVEKYNEEVAYQLCDGYAISNSYYSIHTNIGGTFDSVNEAHDHKKHPISFRFRTLGKMQRLIPFIKVDIEGIADTNGYIDEYIDEDGKNTNTIYLSNGMFSIHGHKIKIEGTDPACGLYFYPANNPAAAVKATRIAENSASKVTGVTPAVPGQYIKFEIRTQYAGSGSNFLKVPRVITSGFTLEQL